MNRISFVCRAKEVLRLVNYKEPSMSPVERAEAEELKKMETKIEEMKIRLLELKKKSEQQTGYTENIEYNEKKKEIVFRGDQEKTIKNSLGHMYVLVIFYKNRSNTSNLLFSFHRAKDIKELITEVKKLEEEVSI